MKTLTLTQPWAQLVVDGRKQYETRGWRPDPRRLVPPFTLAIHAAKGWTEDDRRLALAMGYDPGELPRGAIVAVVTVVAIRRAEELIAEIGYPEEMAGDWSSGRWAWQLADVEFVRKPIPARGALGLWEWTR
jgi:hypothetical protein